MEKLAGQFGYVCFYKGKRKENQIAIDPALEFHLRLIALAKHISPEVAMDEALTRYRNDFEPLAEFLKAAAKKEVKL